ncbi:MAG: DUF5658 family protein [Dehalococcoidia bacterium]
MTGQGGAVAALKRAPPATSIFVLFVLANIVDAATTIAALSNGALEVNPIIIVLVAKVGLLSALAFKVGVSALAGSVLYLRGRTGLLAVLTMGLVLISVNNAVIGLLR